MKPSEVHSAIVATLEELEPETKASTRDKFRYCSELGASSQNRSFTLIDSQWPSKTTSLPAQVVLQFTLAIVYTAGSDALNRRVNDSLLVTDALIGLPAKVKNSIRQYPQIVLVEMLGLSTDHESLKGQVVTLCTVQVRFDARTIA